MINIFLFVFCLVNGHIVDSGQGTFQDDLEHKYHLTWMVSLLLPRTLLPWFTDI